MADMKKDMLSIAALILGLFLVAIIVGVTYVGANEFKETLCTQADADWVYENDQCLNETGGTAQTVTSITKVNVVLTTLDIVLGLIGLVVIILIFSLVIKVAKSFGNTFGG